MFFVVVICTRLCTQHTYRTLLYNNVQQRADATACIDVIISTWVVHSKLPRMQHHQHAPLLLYHHNRPYVDEHSEPLLSNHHEALARCGFWVEHVQQMADVNHTHVCPNHTHTQSPTACPRRMQCRLPSLALNPTSGVLYPTWTSFSATCICTCAWVSSTCTYICTHPPHEYRYHKDKGLLTILTARLLNQICTLGFLIVFSFVLLLCINWHAVREECLLKDTCDISQVGVLANKTTLSHTSNPAHTHRLCSTSTHCMTIPRGGASLP